MRDSIRSRRRRISAPSRPPLPPPAVPPDGRTASILPLPGSFASRGEVSGALPAAPAGAGTGASPPGRMTTPGDCGAGPSGDGSRITANEGAAGRPSVAGRIPCLRGLSAGGGGEVFFSRGNSVRGPIDEDDLGYAGEIRTRRPAPNEEACQKRKMSRRRTDERPSDPGRPTARFPPCPHRRFDPLSMGSAPSDFQLGAQEEVDPR